jgi:hypothetical protein
VVPDAFAGNGRRPLALAAGPADPREAAVGGRPRREVTP